MTTPKFGDNAFVETCFNLCASGADDEAIFRGEWYGLLRLRPMEVTTLHAVPGSDPEQTLVGVIVNEDDQGFVDVIPFEDDEGLTGVWEAIVEEEADYFLSDEETFVEATFDKDDFSDLVPQFWD